MKLTQTQWKQISKILFAISIAGFMLCLSGCAGLPAWLTEGQQVLTLVGPVITTILGFVAALTSKTIDAPVAATITTIVTKAQAGLADLAALEKQYNANPGTTILTDIEQGGKAVVAELQPLLALVDVKDPATQAKIEAFANLAVTQLGAWITELPVLTAPALTSHTITIPFNTKEFKQAFDAIVKAPTGTAAVDAALASIKTL
jgi:hypothetical protein